jgi:Icc-related predicted phosphoesterase
MKFVNSAKFYKANVLVMGGDITGKMVVPIIKQEDGTYKTNFLGIDRAAKDEKELENIENIIRLTGFYPYVTNKDEVAEIGSDEKKLDSLFTKLMINTLDRWLNIAEERLKAIGVKLYLTPGNDDSFEIDELIKQKSSTIPHIINPEGQIVEIDKHHEMISTGYSNNTPFNSPREINEKKLLEKIKNLASDTKNLSTSIFNFHCPPINSGLDTCQKIDRTLKPIFEHGQPAMIGGGSTAVRESIEKYQPLIGLHGHIHECKSAIKIGKTLCVNPGSQYSEGILNGIIINLDEKGIKGHQFTSG